MFCVVSITRLLDGGEGMPWKQECGDVVVNEVANKVKKLCT